MKRTDLHTRHIYITLVHSNTGMKPLEIFKYTAMRWLNHKNLKRYCIFPYKYNKKKFMQKKKKN